MTNPSLINNSKCIPNLKLIGCQVHEVTTKQSSPTTNINYSECWVFPLFQAFNLSVHLHFNLCRQITTTCQAKVETKVYHLTWVQVKCSPLESHELPKLHANAWSAIWLCTRSSGGVSSKITNYSTLISVRLRSYVVFICIESKIKL